MSVPTIVPSKHFDSESDADALRKAMKGLGTDEKAIIEILTHRTSDQRQEILHTYNNKDDDWHLIKDLKKDLGGKFEDLVMALLTPFDNYLAMELHSAMDGVGTNENMLIEILCTRNNASLTEIKKAYQRLYDTELHEAIKQETKGDFEDVLLDLCNCDRDEGSPKEDIASDLAEKLYKAGEGRKGADEDEIRKILAGESFETLRLVFNIYRMASGSTLGEVMEKELEGDFKTAMLAVYNSIKSPASYFAEALHKALAGVGTNDRSLIRILVSRSEIDLESIKREYHTIYDKSLDKAIKGDTAGYYEKMLLSIIRE